MSELPTRIYLDHAATSFPKSAAVAEAMTYFTTHLGKSPGRSSSRAGIEVERVIERCRHQIARLFDVSNSNHVIFTLNGTDSLNTVINGLLQTGDRVITSCWEHNSVLRPLHALKHSRGIQTQYLQSSKDGTIDLGQFQEFLKSRPRLIVMTHASNVTGVIQPIQEMALMAKSAGALFLLDASQTAGSIPVSLTELGIDIIACSGHKGLGGPLGTGVLALKPEVAQLINPLRNGGTGTSSESPEQPQSLPEKFEAGSMNAPGIFGLEAALNFAEQQASFPVSSATQANQNELICQLISGMQEMSGIQVFYPEQTVNRVPVVSVHFEKVAPHVMSNLLEEHFGIETRAGFHCAPLAHQAIGTFEHGGTVRFSFGKTNTSEEVDQTLAAIAEIMAAL